MTSDRGQDGSGLDSQHERLVQRARGIAEGFRVVAEGGGSPRTELALLRSPLHVYEDPERGIEKAVILAWCHVRNPEALICVEFYADRTSVELTKLANARVTAEGHGLVWTTEESRGRDSEAYWSFALPKE